MKKYYGLLLGLIAVGSQVFGQGIATPTQKLDYMEDPYTVILPQRTYGINKKKATESGWLSPITMIQDYGASFGNPALFRLFQDSTVVVVPDPSSGSTDAFRAGFHLYGCVFQPTEALYELQNGWVLNRFDEYTVDSVRFPYSYIRIADSVDVNGTMTEVVDTAIVHFYQAKDLQSWFYTAGSDEVFSVPIVANFDPKILGPKNVLHIDTVLLTKDAATDTAFLEQVQLRIIRVEIPPSVNSIKSSPAAPSKGDSPLNRIGMSVVFKTMIPFSLGDTLVSFNNAAQPVKKLNNFGVVSYTNSGSSVIQTQYYNNSFVSNFQVRYGQTDFNPLRGYLPSLKSAGWNNDFYMDADFHITVDNPNSIGTIENPIGLEVYPNPAKTNSTLLVKLNHNPSPNEVSISMTDILGNNIVIYYTLAGENTYSLSSNGLTKGIYFVTVNSGAASASKRVIISE